MKKTRLIILALLAVLLTGWVSCRPVVEDRTQVYGIQCNRTGTVDGNNVDRRMLDELITSAVKNWELDHTMYWESSAADAETEAKKRFQDAFQDLQTLVSTMNRDLSDPTASSVYRDIDFDLTWTLTLYHNAPSNIIDGPKEVKFRLKIVQGGTVVGPQLDD